MAFQVFQTISKVALIVEILAVDKQEFVKSAQFNYMHDLSWLIEQYPKESREKPLTIVLGANSAAELTEEAKVYPNVEVVKVGQTGLGHLVFSV